FLTAQNNKVSSQCPRRTCYAPRSQAESRQEDRGSDLRAQGGSRWPRATADRSERLKPGGGARPWPGRGRPRWSGGATERGEDEEEVQRGHPRQDEAIADGALGEDSSGEGAQSQEGRTREEGSDCRELRRYVGVAGKVG